MISTFNGTRRSLGQKGEERDFRLMIEAKMRKHLHLFTGSSLNVFMFIALHIDRYNWAWPSVETICRDTKLSDDTVHRALNVLCGAKGRNGKPPVKPIKIRGARVMLRTKLIPPHIPEDKLKNKRARNFYLLFPTHDEVERYEAEDAGDKNLHPQNWDTKIAARIFERPQNWDTKIAGQKNLLEGKESPPSNGTKNQPHTHEEQPAPPAAAEERARVFQDLTFEDYLAYARATPTFTNPDAWAPKHYTEGDEASAYLVREWLNSQLPERVAETRSAQPDERLTYFEAGQIVNSLVESQGRAPAAVIAELHAAGQVSDEVCARLVKRFATAEEATTP